ncbi:ribonuclease H-like domain-containing protein, partial [Aspergillus pseudoustus]
GRGGGASKNTRCVNCRQLGNNKGGCIVLSAHDFAAPDAKLRDMASTPASNPSARKAVVLDCEMVGVLGANNRETSELVRLSAVDFLTGEVLIDTYVAPGGQVISWRTKYSGVSAAVMREQTARGNVVEGGWKAARDRLWGVIDASTVLIGHSLNNDLGVLGMVHARVLDSAILTREAVGGGCNRHWALKVLVQRFLAREIQTGRDGHDCLEDTFAAREVVLWCLRNNAELQAWAAEERGIIAEKARNKAALSTVEPEVLAPA